MIQKTRVPPKAPPQHNVMKKASQNSVETTIVETKKVTQNNSSINNKTTNFNQQEKS